MKIITYFKDLLETLKRISEQLDGVYYMMATLAELKKNE